MPLFEKVQAAVKFQSQIGIKIMISIIIINRKKTLKILLKQSDRHMVKLKKSNQIIKKVHLILF